MEARLLYGLRLTLALRTRDASGAYLAMHRALNDVLVQKINAGNKMYVSGTVWEGKPASRIAVSNWQVDPSRDLEIVKSVLDGLLK